MAPWTTGLLSKEVVEGMAIKIKMIAGAIVHATSINCLSKRNLFVVDSHFSEL